MYKRLVASALLSLVVAAPSFAQPKGGRSGPQIPEPIQAKASFRALFKPVIEQACRSTVDVQVGGEHKVLGTVVGDEYVITKASELAQAISDAKKKSKPTQLSIKSYEGRTFDARESIVSDAFDLSLIKVEGTGLVPVTFGSSGAAPPGNWVAVAGLGSSPVAVGVVGAPARSIGPPYRGRVPLKESGFLGIQLDMGATRATISTVTNDSAADKAGIKAKDTILQIEGNDIIDQETLINTLQTYRAGDKVRIKLERAGKALEFAATLGKRTPDSMRDNRGDFQNTMGSRLSDRRSGIPRVIQTDAALDAEECGSPLVDLDGRVLGVVIARAGRTETHAIPAETLAELMPILLAATASGSPEHRVEVARCALTRAQAAGSSAAILGEGKRVLGIALADEKWWKDHRLELGPLPREVKAVGRLRQ
jgi:serine protease Do